jgi:hypothetical protein
VKYPTPCGNGFVEYIRFQQVKWPIGMLGNPAANGNISADLPVSFSGQSMTAELLTVKREN